MPLDNNAPLLKLQNISLVFHSFGRNGNKDKDELLFDGFSLEVYPGELVAIIGDSGSGKSTLLNIIAGFIKPFRQDNSLAGKIGYWLFKQQNEKKMSGHVFLEGNDISNDEPWERDIGLVMQRFNTYSHMTIQENLEFPLKFKKINKDQRRRKIAELPSQLGINELSNKENVDKMSGGESQRIAIGKILLKDPAIALLDEAFANLDPIRRQTLVNIVINSYLKENQNGNKKRAIIMVTHNWEDAEKADKIVVMRAHKSSKLWENRIMGTSSINVYERSGKIPAWEIFREEESPLDIKIVCLAEKKANEANN